MGTEQNSSFYDNIYKNTLRYTGDYKKSQYLNLWKEMEKFLIEDINVLDIGCGIGETAEFLVSKGYHYTGIDFSQEAIDRARKKDLKDTLFICDDIIQADYSKFENHQFFTCETLEHITEDIELLNKLRKLPGSSNIVVSIPTYDSEGHVRFFEDEIEVEDRYKKIIDIKKVLRFGPFIIIHGII